MTDFVRARIDGELKEQATAVLDGIGLSVSDIIRVVLTRIAKEKAVPVGLFTPNAVTLAAIKEAQEMILTQARFANTQEMFSALEGNKE